VTGERDGTVLVVEDERELADLYADYLADEYDLRVAYTGEKTLEMLDRTIDAVLLDRRMPVVSGNEILAELEERDLGARVALVTAVNPDFDIIDLRIDDYLVKPVTRAEVRETVDRLLTIDEYNERIQELTSKKLKRNVLEVERTRAELEGSEEFERLTAEIEQLEREVESLAEELGVDDLEYV
jgi:response regulator RpfG family c-di-GMP phosphodiesterase